MGTNRPPFAPPKSSWDLTRKPKDEIVEEIHEWRQSYAAGFDFDLERIFSDLKNKEALNAARRSAALPLKPAPPNLV